MRIVWAGWPLAHVYREMDEVQDEEDEVCERCLMDLVGAAARLVVDRMGREEVRGASLDESRA